MTEKKKESHYRINSKAKDTLCSIYTHLLSETKDIDDYLIEINIDSSNLIPNQLIDNIQQLLPLYLNQFKKRQNQLIKEYSNEDNAINDIPKEYESLLRQEEKSIRHQYKIIFQQGLRINYLDTRLEECMAIVEEYKQMRLRYKFEEAKFLNDDRKDNEIIILRSENSKIKTAINQLEKSLKESEANCKEYIERISALNHRIDNLNDSIIKLKQYCDLNTHSNTCYNSNSPTYNNNNQTLSSKLESRQRDDQWHSYDIDKNNNGKNKKCIKLKKRNNNNISSVSMKSNNNILAEVNSTLSKKKKVMACKTVSQLVTNFKLFMNQKNNKTKQMSSISSLSNIIINKKKKKSLAMRSKSVSTP